MMLQGGWAQGVLLNAGFKLDDFIIAPGPSDNGKPVFLLNADAFIFWQRKEADLQAGQTLMANLVMDPAIQTMYSQITGSIPVRTDVDLTGAGLVGRPARHREGAEGCGGLEPGRVESRAQHGAGERHDGSDDRRPHRVREGQVDHVGSGGLASCCCRGRRSLSSPAVASAVQRRILRDIIGRLPERLVIWVPLLLAAGQIVSFAIWTIWVSFTPSTLVPVSGWVGLRNYTSVMATRNWQIAFDNLLLFASSFVVLSVAAGLLLAILLDQRIRGENVLRSIFLYPLAVSFVVTGTVWSWLLNPGLGIQKLVNVLGCTSFRFDWLLDRDKAIWTIVIAAIWQSAGFAMALFLAGLRSVDGDLIKRRADRRGRAVSHLPAHHSSDAVADHDNGRRDPAPVRDHDLRPRPGADRWRARSCDAAARAGGL